MSFVLVIITLIAMLILLGISVERMLGGRSLPQPLLLATGIVTGLWSGLMVADRDTMGSLVLATGVTAIMLVVLRWYNQRIVRKRR